mgnify:FL=1
MKIKIIAFLCLLVIVSGCKLTDVAGNDNNNDDDDFYNFIELDSYLTAGSAFKVTLRQDKAYVAEDNTGLEIVDVSDPNFVTGMGSYFSYDLVRDFKIDNEDFAYIAESSAGLVIADFADDDYPEEVYSYPTTNAIGVEIYDDRLYLLDAVEGIIVFDIEDPFHTIAIEYYSGNLGIMDLYDIYADPPYLYVTYDFGVAVLYMDSYGSLEQIADYETNYSVFEMEIQNDVGYLATWDGIETVDLSDPYSPDDYDQLSLPNSAVSIDVYGNKAYLATEAYGLRIVDISSPYGLYETDYYYTDGSVKDVEVQGDNLFIADGSKGLLVLEYWVE